MTRLTRIFIVTGSFGLFLTGASFGAVQPPELEPPTQVRPQDPAVDGGDIFADPDIEERPIREEGPAIDPVLEPSSGMIEFDARLSLLNEKIDRLSAELHHHGEKLDLHGQLLQINQRLAALEGPGRGNGAPVAPANFAAAASADGSIAGKVWCLIAVDNRRISGGSPNQIFEGTANNGLAINTLVEAESRRNPSTGQLEDHWGGATFLEDTEFTFANLKNAVVTQQVGPNDVLFVYFACHGYQTASGELGFQMPLTAGGSEGIPRSEVWKLLKSKQARQTILFSDSCASRALGSASGATSLAFAADRSEHALSWLLLFQTGDVDINGADPTQDNLNGFQGQVGIYRTGNGAAGYATQAFIQACSTAPVPVSWKSLFDGAQQNLLGNFPIQLPGQGRVPRQDFYLVP